MKKTLITIGITTVVIFTLIALVAIAPAIGGAQFSPVSRNLGGGYDDYALAEPAFAPASAPMPMAEESFAYDMPAEESAVTSKIAVQQERLVIQNVDMSIVVVDPKMRMEEIGDLAVEMGGFVVSSNLFQSTYGPNQVEIPEGNINIRVPSERLDEALDNIKEGAVDIQYENRSGEDVTSEYVDLDSRLTVLRTTEENFLEILDNADTTEDTLAVYAQLRQIQTEIEVIEGQMKYYRESAALSSIRITLIAEEKVKPVEIGPWRLQGTANDAVQDLIQFTQGFTRFLIRFVLFNLPSLILIAIPLYGAFIGVRALYRRFRKSKPEADFEATEKKKKK
ncbi:MAG TPA: DUF4349 domain-containing protein [Anaerolineales bacterium]|jgi:hypothetical protein|nr:DUF4349 domain-containing protein [Anaerolineales bacterium]